METNFYVVGDNRGTEFFLRNIKFFLWLLLSIIFALSIVVIYQFFSRQLDKELLAERIQQEKTLSENLIAKLKKTGQQDAEWLVASCVMFLLCPKSQLCPSLQLRLG